MTTVLVRTASLVLAAAVTAATFGVANATATRQYVKADAIAVAQMQVLAAQTVVIVGHRT